jgi:hypothetical protein
LQSSSFIVEKVKLLVVFAVPMLHIKSFPPDRVPSSKQHHYHDSSDFAVEKTDSIWLWLLEHRNCKKIVLIKDESCYSPVKTSCKIKSQSNAEMQSDPLIDEAATDSPDSYRFLPFHDVGVFQRVEDSVGNTWEISIEVPEGTGSIDAILIRTYRLHLLLKEGVKIKNCLESTNLNDRLFQVFSLDAHWDVDHFPVLAEFKRQVTVTI